MEEESGPFARPFAHAAVLEPGDAVVVVVVESPSPTLVLIEASIGPDDAAPGDEGRVLARGATALSARQRGISARRGWCARRAAKEK